MKQFIFIIAALLGIGCMLNAQQTVGVTTDSLRIERNGEYIVVDMNMGLSPLEVDINRAVLLTPRFVCATDTLELPSIGVYGRQRYYYYVRNAVIMAVATRYWQNVWSRWAAIWKYFRCLRSCFMSTLRQRLSRVARSPVRPSLTSRSTRRSFILNIVGIRMNWVKSKPL